MKIDLNTIDRTQFNVDERELNGAPVRLITPRKDKHRWEPHELWLRSVLTDVHGNPISVGFPKFMNYHEQPEYYDECLGNSFELEVREKMDGTLIILSFHREFGRIIRTRGSHELGDFEDAVMGLIEEKYPDILDAPNFLEGIRPEHLEGRSYLFEYTAPDNQIVVVYMEPKLTYLGFVEHGDPEFLPEYYPPKKNPAYDPFSSVPPVDMTVESPLFFKSLMDKVRKCTDNEGVVIRIIPSEWGEREVLVKVKAEWYVMIHALRFQMTEKKLNMLLALAYDEIACFGDLQSYLYRRGYDFEVAEFLKEPCEAFFTRDIKYRGEAEQLIRRVAHKYTRGDRSERKFFVQRVRKVLEDEEFTIDTLFQYAMAWYDNKVDLMNALHLAHAAQTSAKTALTWIGNEDSLLSGMLKTPEDFEDDNE